MRKPDRNDAWLLAAIHMGNGQPRDAVCWADHINATCADQKEWVSACEVLGRLGLIIEGDTFPTTSPLGAEIFREIAGPGIGARMYPVLILAKIANLPEVGRPVQPPTAQVLLDAEEEHAAMCNKVVEQAIAKWAR